MNWKPDEQPLWLEQLQALELPPQNFSEPTNNRFPGFFFGTVHKNPGKKKVFFNQKFILEPNFSYRFCWLPDFFLVNPEFQMGEFLT